MRRVDVREYGGFEPIETKENKPKTKEDREKENTIELGVIYSCPIEQSRLWRKRLWKKYSRRLKDAYAQQGKKVELLVESKVEETVIGYHEINHYIVVTHEGQEVEREKI